MTRFTGGGADGFPVVLRIAPEDNYTNTRQGLDLQMTLEKARELLESLESALEWAERYEGKPKEAV